MTEFARGTFFTITKQFSGANHDVIARGIRHFNAVLFYLVSQVFGCVTGFTDNRAGTIENFDSISQGQDELVLTFIILIQIR